MIQHLFLGSPVSESGLQTSRPGPLRLLRATDEGSANPRGDTHLLRAGFIPPYDGKAVFFIAETRLVKASRCSFIISSHFCDEQRTRCATEFRDGSAKASPVFFYVASHFCDEQKV